MPEIEPADQCQRRIALELVLSKDDVNVQQNAQFLSDLIDRGELDERGLLVETDGGEITGAILCQVLPGNMAALWAPRATGGEQGALDRLIAASLAWLGQRNVRLVQALLRLQDQDGQRALQRAGFLRAADLLYLAWLVDPQWPVVPTAEELDFLPYSSKLHDRFAAVMERSYDQTLDCPALNGRRNIDEVIAGYRATGEFSADRWLLVQHDQVDVGCLLLTDHSRTNQWELIYMGLIPAARGKHFGKKLVEHAQRLTATAGRQALSLAVDANNTPALRVYRQNGFFLVDGRRAMLYEMPVHRHSRGAEKPTSP